MKQYTITRQYNTGVYRKPHTIELDTGKRVSVVYYDEESIDLPETATATAKDGTVYRIFENDDGSRTLAVKKG